MHKLIPMSKIKPNPFRKMDRYPIDEKKIESLMSSIKKTGFWDNVVGRERNGHVELGYGHHRWITLKRIKYPKMNMIIRDISDADMLRMMVNENENEYGSNALIEQENVRSIVEAYFASEEECEIYRELSKVPKKARNDTLRFAPLFAKGCVRESRTHRPYTALSIAEFGGWTTRGGSKGIQPKPAITTALDNLEAIEQNLIDEEDTQGLSRRQAETVRQEAVKINRTYEQASKASNDPEQQRKTKKKGRAVARKAAKKAAASMRPDPKTGKQKLGMREAATQMQRSRAEEPEHKRMPTVEKFVSTLTNTVMKVLGEKDPKWVKINEVVKYRENIDAEVKKNLTVALKTLMRRCEVLIDAIDGGPKKLTK